MEEIKEKELNHRAYVNSLNISSLDNRIIPGFLSEYATIPSPKGVHLPFENQLNLSSASNLRKLAHYGSTWRIPYSSASNGMLTEFLFSGTTILSFESCPEQSVIAFLDIDLKTRWIALYDLARKSRTAEKISFWRLLLASLAFAGKSIEQLELLHTVAVHADSFKNINPPKFTSYSDIQQRDYNHSAIYSLFEGAKTNFNEYLREKYLREK